jgi:FkbM family methyltransferase
LGRFFDRKTAFVGYRKKGVDILIDHIGGDEGGTRMVVATDMYSKYLPYLELPGPARVLDLGANGGGFPLMLKISGVNLAKVVSVEMNPMTFLRLQVNLATNLRSSAIAINAAACGLPAGREILLTPTRGGTGDSMYGDLADPNDPHVSVRTTTLQALYDQYFKSGLLDICKIDIEGAEYELFESSSDEMVCKIRYLIMEFHDTKNRMQPLLNRILSLGFQDVTFLEGHQTTEAAEVRIFIGPQAKTMSVPHNPAT